MTPKKAVQRSSKTTETKRKIKPMPKPANPSGWTIADAIDTYNVDRWGGDYFEIGANGHVHIKPCGTDSVKIDLVDVVKQARSEGLRFPLLLRFQDILRDRVVKINRAFYRAIEEENYQGNYRGVFPVKVNQLREVVEEIVDAGKVYHTGLEVGSKPELMAALAIHEDDESFIICNGYKDEAYIRMAMMGRRLGKRVMMVAEKIEEVKAIVSIAQDLHITPAIGFRVRLATPSEGMWATSSGESAKFGLTTMDLMEALKYLKEENKLNTVRLVHFHIGSQIPSISAIKNAVREAARYYAKMRKMGMDHLDYMDVGGGLGVDYDGSNTNSASSANYSLQEYASDIVYTVKNICDSEIVPHPTLISESGRAIVAYHTVLVVEAFGAIEKTKSHYDLTVFPNDHPMINQMADIKNAMMQNPLEALHDAQQIKDDSRRMFELGNLDLETKARIETFYWHVVEEVVDEYKRRADSDSDDSDLPEEIYELLPHMADQYLCNFSVFQSLMDYWALGQVFPIMPIHRLDEEPTVEGVLVDITCDSDGKVCDFVDIKEDSRPTLPLHPLKKNESYLLGFFMTGAYQDIMGDLHNLFGRANEAHIFVDEMEDGGFYIEEMIKGNSISQVLEQTQYNKRELEKNLRRSVSVAIKRHIIRANDGMKLLAEYEQMLTNPTYLDFSQNEIPK
ncbi:MAG: biosynthetic arginine decarboxylase [Candidatus Sumerlaeales bacterium]|nr:biosynthetic arginine decarboxylase [Candidatus Sumerlaeales bacterium]